MFDRSSLSVLLMALASTAACAKNDGRSPGLIEGVAGDVGNEIDGAGNTVDGVGKDVTNTVDRTSPSPPPATDAAEAEAPDADEAADEPSGA